MASTSKLLERQRSSELKLNYSTSVKKVPPIIHFLVTR